MIREERQLRELGRLANPDHLTGNIGAVLTVDLRDGRPAELAYSIDILMPDGSARSAVGATFDEALAKVTATIAGKRGAENG